jgi:tRNA dimethylallyltransferase
LLKMLLPRLIIIAGPTAVGKTTVAINLALALKTEIINADSRQVYREMIIGTAAPSEKEQSIVRHHFAGHRSICDPYNASMFEQEVISFLGKQFKDKATVIMAGGSGLYIDAVCNGIDDLPSVDQNTRSTVLNEFHKHGLEGIRLKLKQTDPEYYNRVDLSNPKRIMKALEISLMTGKPYSAFLTGKPKERNFSIIRIALDLPRQLLHERINLRVDQMMENGLLEEAKSLYPYRHLNALNTVGYKELFSYLEGSISLPDAITKIKDHSRQYARRQLTWFRRDKNFQWFQPTELEKILDFINHPDGTRQGVSGGCDGSKT